MASVIELEVTAAPEQGQFTVRVVRSAAGAGSTAAMQLDPQTYVDSRDDLETAVLASAVTGRRILSPGEQRLRAIGQQLFDALFSGPVGEAYRASVDSASARGERLQVVLRMDVPGLAAIPWECMYDVQNGEYIGLTDPLIRHIPSTDVEPLTIVPPLKVLVLVSSPGGLATLDVEAERRKLSQALAEPIADGRIQLSWLMQATWENVQDKMLSGTWHVLHFIGHGDYDKRTDQGVIALVADDGGIHLVEADRLAGLLNEAQPTPRLVVLNSCQSGRSGTQDLFSSTAATLVRRGINAVAAMQFSISDAGATKFARGLYSALASGRSIGDAIGSGRVGLLSTPGSLEWVTPVLYVRGDTSTLFTITPAPPRPAPPPVQSADGQTRTGPSRKVLASRRRDRCRSGGVRRRSPDLVRFLEFGATHHHGDDGARHDQGRPAARHGVDGVIRAAPPGRPIPVRPPMTRTHSSGRSRRLAWIRRYPVETPNSPSTLRTRNTRRIPRWLRHFWTRSVPSNYGNP